MGVIYLQRPKRNDSREMCDMLMKRMDAITVYRTNWESMWQQIADRILPRAADFQLKRAEGERRTEHIFDSTASLALERFAAALESVLTPRFSKWHQLRLMDDDLNEDTEIGDWLDDMNNTLWEERYRPQANFANQYNEIYMSLGAFGTGGSFIEEGDSGAILRYCAPFLGEIYIALNRWGMVDTVFRKFEWTARQAGQKWGAENLPDMIRTCLLGVKGSTNPDRKFTFIHAVMPREDINSSRMDFMGMPYASYYMCQDCREMVGEGGFWTFPYPISRYVTSSRETYGRSPASLVLPEIKMLNAMRQTTIRIANRAVDPPLLAHDDGILQAISMKPAAVNFGGVNEAGQPLVHPMNFGNNFQVAQEEMNYSRETINAAFLVTLFQILVETPEMTATEALLRAQEKGALLAPTMGRQQSELIGPTITREMDILGRRGRLKPPPEKLQQLLRADYSGAQMKIEYTSPMNRAMRADEATGILRTVESMAPFAQARPEILDVLDWDEATRVVAYANNVPSKVINSKEKVAAMGAQRAQASQASALLQAAPVVSSSIKDITDAQQSQQQAKF